MYTSLTSFLNQVTLSSSLGKELVKEWENDGSFFPEHPQGQLSMEWKISVTLWEVRTVSDSTYSMTLPRKECKEKKRQVASTLSLNNFRCAFMYAIKQRNTKNS